MAAFVVKVAVGDVDAARWSFPAVKTMYGGKTIAPGDVAYLIASENEGGAGLIARCSVAAAARVPPRPGVERQTPRVDVELVREAKARQPLGRRELKPFADWTDGRPETELNFKLYRQATNKIVGVTAATAAFLAERF